MRGILLGMGLMLATPVAAMDYAGGVPGDEVGRLVRAAMAEAGEAVPDFADPPRAYPPCAGNVSVRARQGSWSTAEISCDAPVWSRALRTGAMAPARGVSQDSTASGRMVVTLARSLPRGTVLTADDIVLAPADARQPDEIFTDPSQVIGRRIKAALGEGKPLLLRQLEPVWLVAKGSHVLLAARAGGLSVSAPAEALEDGGMGDVIRVLNLSSQREVKVMVTGQNSVTAQTNMR
ncbi:MAG: flagellar basal body P-ring formation chaperone FlgA [Paracoccaceae bacterium]